MADDQRLLDATDTRPRQPSLGLSLGRGRRVTSSATTGLTSAVVAVAAIARGSGRDVAEARIESSIEQLSVAKDKAHTSSPRDEQQPSSATGACDIHKTWTVALTTPATTPAAIATSLDFFVTTLKTKHARNVPERLRFECWSYVKRNATRMSAMTNDLSPFTVNPCKCLEVVALLTDDGRCILPMELEVLPVLQRWFSMCDERELAHNELEFAHNEQESAHNEQLQETVRVQVLHYARTVLDHHAAMLPSAQLETLLECICDMGRESPSSTTCVQLETFEIINVIARHGRVPAASLPHIARFLAFTSLTSEVLLESAQGPVVLQYWCDMLLATGAAEAKNAVAALNALERTLWKDRTSVERAPPFAYTSVLRAAVLTTTADVRAVADSICRLWKVVPAPSLSLTDLQLSLNIVEWMKQRQLSLTPAFTALRPHFNAVNSPVLLRDLHNAFLPAIEHADEHTALALATFFLDNDDDVDLHPANDDFVTTLAAYGARFFFSFSASTPVRQAYVDAVARHFDRVHDFQGEQFVELIVMPIVSALALESHADVMAAKVRLLRKVTVSAGHGRHMEMVTGVIDCVKSNSATSVIEETCALFVEAISRKHLRDAVPSLFECLLGIGQAMTDETQSWLALSTLLRLRSDGSGYYIQGTAQSLYYGAKPQLPTALIIDLVRLQLTSIVISFSTLNTVLIQHQSQLLNRPLYAEDVLALQTLCSTICDSVLNDRLAHHARHLAPFQRGDVYRPVLSHLLALAAAYRHIFSKHQQDEIVLCFATGLHRWTTTIQQCIHALTILALILPLSTAKHLPSILLRYQQIMSGPSTSVHILEFLSTLARNHTSLHRDFVDEDFRRVLGIAMQYIASHREQLAVAHGRLGVATAAFSQYVLNLAYQVIVAWLLCLKPMERLRLRPFVVRGLMAPYKKDDGDMAEVDEKTEACLETVFWLTAAESEGAEESRPMDGSAATVKPQSQKFICGDMATLTLSYYDGSSVHAQIRRTVGTREWWFVMGSDATRALQALRTALLPAHIVDLNGIAPLPSVEDLIRGGPQHALAFVQRLIIDTGVEITALANEDAAVERSLNVLDRTPVIDLHKIGVVYVGLGQRGEAEILANSAGSQDYDAFLSALGSRVLLKECPMLDLFTGGLDTFDNLDGEWACYWRDQVQQLIFHVGTLMPTNTATDPRCNAKKRHIGNDFVTIVFDESGEDYAFDTISSQFNFVNVVVRPVRESVVKGMAQDATSAALDQLFSVSMQRRSDMPDIGPLAEPKIVVGAVQAAAFARAVSFHANVYAQVYEQLFRRQTGSSAASRSNSMGSSAAAPRNSTTGMPPSPMTSTGDARPLQRARPSLATMPAAQLSNVSLAVAANDDEYVSNTRERLRQLRRIAVRARSKCVSE